MKTILLIPFALALPVLAGTSAKEVIAPVEAPAPCIFTWFAGASVGYLTEFEEPMYNLHVGTDTCWSLGGWNLALFAEVGYTEKDEDWSGREPQPPLTSQPPILIENPIENPLAADGGSYSLDGVADALSDLANMTPYGTGYDLDIIPITLNAKLERPLTGKLNAYFGGGLGVALVDFSADVGPFGDFSDEDWVFTAQIFAGLNYDVCEHFEVYGGARWIYFDDAELSDNGVSGTLELEDDFLFELGGRYNF